MAKAPFLSVVIPAFDEAERIPFTLIDLDRYLSRQDYSYEILVVDDGSSDATSRIVSHFSELIPRLTVLYNPDHRGKGAVMKLGMLTAKGDWRLLMDADNSVTIREFEKILPFIQPRREYDIVVASRSVRGTILKPNFPFFRRIAEWKINILSRIFFKLPVRDSLIGFKCFSRDAADRVFGATRLTEWATDLESLVLSHTMGYRTREVSFRGQFVSGGHFSFIFYLQFLWRIATIRWWLSRGRYALSHPEGRYTPPTDMSIT
ncbi:MAG: hypothetical protein COU08_03235 [Candidatus Harrisonbacteria bacterium CG10_big_fil_rev_8_21_14_0_10_42_17]|uniref:Glycosyltransferase 2-like domain-containing protein n=1 Tax=Candidatus Harrisonbacteria bacterium CG10_big_fil_rev_8_21_14_0_10_42_17 TaxID=1974584 RepID=A0A2M6WHN0_9BACT|nr:MAG: hypothetical protein COU08_03235 [Candidatus Harrisonbacteria bacterium CG10_big_fil_rev_8_21_14_0_10_42_17]